MPGRDVSFTEVRRRRPGSTRVVIETATALALLGIGVVIGSRIASSRGSSAASVAMVTVANSGRPSPQPATVASPSPTRASAVAAAARSITAFEGDVLLRPNRLQAVVARIASTESRAQLTAAFEQASIQTRAKLGAGTVPAPVIVLRSVPIGYRVQRYSSSHATIAVWYVGIVGSGATVQPQQSWRTQVVTLVWEDGAWKVSSFQSSAGPTPPLSTSEIPGSSGQLFNTIPRFEEFSNAAH